MDSVILALASDFRCEFPSHASCLIGQLTQHHQIVFFSSAYISAWLLASVPPFLRLSMVEPSQDDLHITSFISLPSWSHFQDTRKCELAGSYSSLRLPLCRPSRSSDFLWCVRTSPKKEIEWLFQLGRLFSAVYVQCSAAPLWSRHRMAVPARPCLLAHNGNNQSLSLPMLSVVVVRFVVRVVVYPHQVNTSLLHLLTTSSPSRACRFRIGVRISSLFGTAFIQQFSSLCHRQPLQFSHAMLVSRSFHHLFNLCDFTSQLRRFSREECLQSYSDSTANTSQKLFLWSPIRG